MKPSQLMLKGYAMAGGKQCKHTFCEGYPEKPTAVCANGAINLAYKGNAKLVDIAYNSPLVVANIEFKSVFGIEIAEANNKGMLIEDIAGILAAEGV